MARRHSNRVVNWRVAVLVVIVVGVAGGPVATAGTSAHQFVTFGDRPFTATAGETVTIPVDFHQTDATTLTVGDSVRIQLRDDGDGVLRVRIDLTDPVAVTVTSGTAQERTGDELTPGNYTLTLDPPTGIGDETYLVVSPPTDQTATEQAAQTATEADGTESSPASPSPAGPPSSTDPATGGGGENPSLFVVLAALFGPAVPVAALAVVARTRR